MAYKEQGVYLPEFEHDNCGAGFICSLNGEKTHEIIHDAIEILIKLEHRGAVSADGRTGDGAGILTDIPHKFFNKVCKFKLPDPKDYGVGMVFLPKSKNQYRYCIDVLETEINNQNLKVLGWSLGIVCNPPQELVCLFHSILSVSNRFSNSFRPRYFGPFWGLKTGHFTVQYNSLC